MDKLVKLICKNEDELNAGLTEKQKETFEKFKDCTSELFCITEREAFSSGFTHLPTHMASVRVVMCMPKPTKNVKSNSKK